MQIRSPKLGDEAEIAKVHIEMWKAAYKGIMPESLLQSLDLAKLIKGWSKTLSNPGKGLYFVAEEDGEIVGFTSFGPARDSDLDDKKSAELVAINIAPSHWRQNIGKKLLSEVLNSLNKNYETLYLWVAEKNLNAIAFYKQLGFAPDGESKTDSKHGHIVELRYSIRLC